MRGSTSLNSAVAHERAPLCSAMRTLAVKQLLLALRERTADHDSEEVEDNAAPFEVCGRKPGYLAGFTFATVAQGPHGAAESGAFHFDVDVSRISVNPLRPRAALCMVGCPCPCQRSMSVDVTGHCWNPTACEFFSRSDCTSSTSTGSTSTRSVGVVIPAGVADGGARVCALLCAVSANR
jgi:hypothetical protein